MREGRLQAGGYPPRCPLLGECRAPVSPALSACLKHSKDPQGLRRGSSLHGAFRVTEDPSEH